MPRDLTLAFFLPLLLSGQTPTVTAVAYPGGSVRAVATDPMGNLYITGTTTGGIPLVNALQPKPGGGNCSPESFKLFQQCPNVFVAKFDPTGTKLIYSTYPSGDQSDYAAGIAVDSAGNAYIAGTTAPAGMISSPYAPAGNAFVKKLSPDGSALVYTRYIGGTTEAFGIAVDAKGNATITGLNLGDFPSVNPLAVQPTVKSLYVTNDGGQTWRTLANGLNATNVNSLVIDPTNRSTLYTATSSGFYKSNNAGANWSRLMPNVPSGDFLVLDYRRPSTLYATYGKGSHLARSTDSGTTWTVLDGNLPTLAPPQLGGFAIDPADSNVLWATIDPNRFGTAIIKSLDSGDHWQTVRTFPSDIIATTLVGRKFLIDPQINSRLYACCISGLTTGTGGVYRSDDGGKTWVQGDIGPLGGGPVGILSPWLDPQNSSTLYADWYYGLERSTDAGMTWSAVSLPPGLTPNQYEPGGLALDASGTIYLLNDTGYMLRSTNHGATWTKINGPWAPLATILAIDPTDSSTIYVASGASFIATGVLSQHAFIAKLDSAGTIQWATLLGGSSNDEAHAVALDSTDDVYVTGQTYSTDFPTVNPFQSALGKSTKSSTANAFISKISADGSKLLYSSYLGGSGTDSGNAVVVDATGNAYVAGGTSYGTTFPLVNSLRTDLVRVNAASFLSKVDPTGGKLLFSTLLSGSAGYPVQDQATAIALDPQRGVLVGGYTGDLTMPLVNPIQTTFDLGSNFLFRLPSGTSPDFSTYLGHLEEFLRAMALAPNGSLWVAGATDTVLARIDFRPLTAQPGVPLIRSVNNAASFVPEDVVAPGEIVTIIGEELAPAVQAAGSGSLPSSMQGVSVSIGGLAAPLFYVAPTQINLQVPFEVALASAPLIVRRGQQNSASRNVNVKTTDPGIFSTPSGVAAVVHAADFSLVTQQNPAHADEYVAVFCAGLGAADPAAITGQPAATAAPLKAYVFVGIGLDAGLEIAPSYAGLAPGLVGLYQINFPIPRGLPGGTQEVFIDLGVSRSNHVTLWVR